MYRTKLNWACFNEIDISVIQPDDSSSENIQYISRYGGADLSCGVWHSAHYSVLRS